MQSREFDMPALCPRCSLRAGRDLKYQRKNLSIRSLRDCGFEMLPPVVRWETNMAATTSAPLKALIRPIHPKCGTRMVSARIVLDKPSCDRRNYESPRGRMT